MSARLPSVVVVSCCDASAANLATAIVDNDEVAPESKFVSPESSDDSATVETFHWNIDTKYYVANVEVCAVRQQDVCCTSQSMSETLNAMEALVIQFDSGSTSSFRRTRDLMKLVNDFDTEVRLLVCNNIDDDSVVRKSDTQKWCLDNGFEMIELEPKETTDEEDFPDAVGVKRVVQALHAHTWPNLVLKERPSSNAPAFANVRHSTIHAQEEILSIGSLPAAKCATDDSSHSFGTEAADPIEDGDCGGIGEHTFEALFQKFQSMKDVVKNLPMAERKDYAEKVAIAFWKAIGGDDEDISGLDENETL